MLNKISFIILIFLISIKAYAQGDTIFNPEIKYNYPKKYKIENIEVLGISNFDKNVILQISRLKTETTVEIPGKKISDAIKLLYKQGVFSDVKIKVDKIFEDKIYLIIELKELPRLSQINITGVKKNEKDKILKQLNIRKGMQASQHLVKEIDRIVKKFYTEKGFFLTKVIVVQKDDPVNKDQIILDINIRKNKKIKVNQIFISGNKNVKSKKVKKWMKKTNESTILNFFKNKKYLDEKFEEDKTRIIDKFNEIGYRDAVILSDSIEQVEDNRINVYIDLLEGNKYYFNNISWVGNTIYTSEILNRYLKLKKGDIYNKKSLDERLLGDDDAVWSLYLNNGYVFSQIDPNETVQGKDSINLEIRIFEGKQATINKIIIKGNDQTHEHVARRELYDHPGDLFSRLKLKRSVLELNNLGNFQQESIQPDIQPNIENNTVDIIYNLEERSNDQFEISGGYGGGSFVGKVGFRFSNFSIGNLFKMKAWSPLPVGDHQTFAINATSNGSYYNSISVSFHEPWLGGKKPNQFGVSFSATRATNISSAYTVTTNTDPNRDQKLNMIEFSVYYGKRLKWPDNYFRLVNSINISRYRLNNWYGLFGITDGTSNIFSFSSTFSRQSIDNPIYTRHGSIFSLKLELTPPYSTFEDIDYNTASDEEIFKFTEFHKWDFNASIYKPIDLNNKLVFHAKVNYGFLGYYDKNKRSPYKGYRVGGDGLSTGQSSIGTQFIGLRGYENNSVTPSQNVANLYSKMTMEIRYPISLNPSSTIYVLGFVEAGNSWYDFKDFEPFNLKRSAGIGFRIFLPIFGLLGLDWGYGFDSIPGKPNSSGSKIHFRFGLDF